MIASASSSTVADRELEVRWGEATISRWALRERVSLVIESGNKELDCEAAFEWSGLDGDGKFCRNKSFVFGASIFELGCD